ncbi:hypothetical protein Pcinc_040493 [Petrolisthes cinctipes]|uniref:Uncharacterized protein n=1 Tax=Petrolisthes cinctipes TaxID=88211 RepID=A0AAE1EHZ5_PETCI|nr:hypothetical protein Pcinc_040493 [Petrolisthes cinctipes]
MRVGREQCKDEGRHVLRIKKLWEGESEQSKGRVKGKDGGSQSEKQEGMMKVDGPDHPWPTLLPAPIIKSWLITVSLPPPVRPHHTTPSLGVGGGGRGGPERTPTEAK